MVSLRIVAASAAVIAAAAMAGVSGAAAQTGQPDAAAGKPIQLLNIVERPAKAASSAKAANPKAASHTKTAAKPQHRRVAKKAIKGVPAPAKVAAAPAVDPPPDQTPTAGQPIANVVTVAGQSVEVAPPDDINDIDRAAGAATGIVRKNAAEADTATGQPAEAPTPGGLAAQPLLSEAPAVPPAEIPGAPVVTAAPQSPTAPTNDNAPWLAEALAALGGAVAAASAAWFMIGSAPQRLQG